MFEQSPERVEAFEKWYDQKREWEKSEEPLRDALNVFLDLFDLYGKFERESETLQLFVADGILRIKKQDVLIHHPILLQRVELVFNPSVPEFLIKESPEGPELYTPLLRYVGIDGKAIQQLREQIARDSLHPLDAQATSEFFKSFIHKFWPDGLYGESIAQIPSDDVPCIYRGPLFFLGYRGQGYVEALESYIEKLPALDRLPEALLRLVGREESPAKQAAGDAAATSSIDLLLTKHANPEQRRVIEELETKDTVMVQGPPGTGKTHTIANLIGHLLAKRQRILVTSHASKALRVVKEHVAPSLRPLCVSVLHGDDDSSKELQESISGIINYLAKASVAKLDKEIREIESERMELTKESAELRQKLRHALLDRRRNHVKKQIVLNFITPHQKWGIHSTYTDNLLMLTLSRGGPIVWISEKDARAAGIVDNDWIEAYNSNGALVARAVVSQRVKQGMCMMYHAQEKIVNVPGSEMTGQRGGIHNSVTRIVVKPTHMIGGYAQQSYGFNYYGTIGTNRDEFVIVRKMAKVDWLDRPTRDSLSPPAGRGSG